MAIYNEPLVTESGQFLLTESGEQLVIETDVAIPDSTPAPPTGVYTGIKNFIMRRMGHPRIKIYMTEEQIDDCIWLAIDRYFEYIDLKMSTKYISGLAGQRSYDIPAGIVPKMIHEVIFKPTDPLLSLTGVMQDVYILYYLQNAGGASNFIVDYWMTLASYEEYTRVLGNQPHWEILNDKLYLDPTPSTGFTIGIKYSELPSESIIENTRWIREYALAQSKLVEGEIRSKFSSFSAGSGEVSLNGDALKSDAVQEIQRLEEWLFQRQSPLDLIIG
jgi:hypothetical protein